MTRMVLRVVLAGALATRVFSFGALALAQTTTPELTPPSDMAGAGLSAPSTPAEMRRQGDASVDRNILSPTAETLNEGQLTFNSYELFLAGLSYGVTNDFQLTATTLLPITDDFPFVLAVAGKYRLHKDEKSIFSVQPTVIIFSVDGTTVGMTGAYALYDRILDDAGKVALTFGGSALGVFGSSEGDVDLSDGLLMTMSAGISARTGRIVKLMGELVLPAGYHDGEFEALQEGLLFNYGVRFFGPTLAVDLTFLRPIHPDAQSELIMGVPFVTFSARF